MESNEIISQIQAAIPVQTQVKITDMTWCDGGILIEVYSNGDAGNTVITRAKADKGIDAIVAEHLAAREPKAQKKARKIADKVHCELYCGR